MENYISLHFSENTNPKRPALALKRASRIANSGRWTTEYSFDKNQVTTLNVTHLIGEAIPQAVCRRLLTTEAQVPSQAQALWDFVIENVSKAGSLGASFFFFFSCRFLLSHCLLPFVSNLRDRQWAHWSPRFYRCLVASMMIRNRILPYVKSMQSDSYLAR